MMFIPCKKNVTDLIQHLFFEYMVHTVKFVIRIPSGTYPGQLETARSFKSIAKLLLRHYVFWQLMPIIVYQMTSYAIMHGLWIGSSGQVKIMILSILNCVMAKR